MAPAFLQAAPRQLVRVDVVQLVAVLVGQLVAGSSSASTWKDNAAGLL